MYNMHFEQVGIGMKLSCLLFIFLQVFLCDGKFAIFIVKHCLVFGVEMKLEIFFNITHS